MKKSGQFLIYFFLLLLIKADLLDKLENVINDKNEIYDEINKDVNDSIKDLLKDDSKAQSIHSNKDWKNKEKVFSQQSNNINQALNSSNTKDNQQTINNQIKLNTQNDIYNTEYKNQNKLSLNYENMNFNDNNNKNLVDNLHMIDGTDNFHVNNPSQNNNPKYQNINNNLNSQIQFSNNMSNSSADTNNYQYNPINSKLNPLPYLQNLQQINLPYSNIPIANGLSNYEMNNNKMANQEISQYDLNQMNMNMQEDNSDIIFDHLFINFNGDKELPNMKSKWTFDEINNEFILPEESKYYNLYLTVVIVLKEDDMTKIQRIYSILETMDIGDNSSPGLNVINQSKFPNFVTPPILDGFETKLNQINKNDEKHKRENIKNIIIKEENDNNMIQKENRIKTYINIRAPPNFFY